MKATADYQTGWHAFEVESHGYSWEVEHDGRYVADVVPADGGGLTGRAEVTALARGLDPTAEVSFHTHADWLIEQDAIEGVERGRQDVNPSLTDWSGVSAEGSALASYLAWEGGR